MDANLGVQVEDVAAGPLEAILNLLAGMATETDEGLPSLPGAGFGVSLCIFVAVGALIGLATLLALDFATGRLARMLPAAIRERFLRSDIFSYAPVLLTLVGAVGVQLAHPVVILLLIILC